MKKDTTVIEAGRALVGRDLRPLHDALITVEGTRIGSLGRRDEVAAKDADRVDAADLLVLPGFIDAHVHIGFFEPRDIVANGVTTVRDLAWPPEVIFELVERSRAPDFDGPAVVAAGPMLTAPGGYPTRAAWAPEGTGLPVSTPAAARSAVAQLVRAGASVIKIALNPEVGPVLDEALLTEIVDVAHDYGLKVTGHISGIDELKKALRAGVDELAHMLMSFERIPDETIKEMVARGVAVVPTLSIRSGRDRKRGIENLARFAEAGGTVVYGTDLGNEGPRPGIDPLEIDSMSKAGFTAGDIIRSATVDSAGWLGLKERGVIETGASADMVAVPLSALESPQDLCDVAMVWRAGRRVR